MRVLIVTPRQPRATGNYATASRHGSGLESLGWTVRILEAPEHPLSLDREVTLFRPDVLLLLHAYRTGHLWLGAPRTSGLPAAVLLTGTDIHGGLDSPAEGPVIRRVLLRAAAAITQNRLTFEGLREKGALFSRLHYLPPGIILGSEHYPLRHLHGIPSGEVLFLHPAGIRPVKGNLELLRLFDRLAGSRSGFRIAFCGPVLDEAYGGLFREELEKRPWALYLGTVPPAAMAAALVDADVVVNNSVSEGMPNALLEAVVLGRPVLARAIPGNAAVVEDGVNGLLYLTPEEFARHALSLIGGPELRRRLSHPRPGSYTPEEEARALDSLLRNLP